MRSTLCILSLLILAACSSAPEVGSGESPVPADFPLLETIWVVEAVRAEPTAEPRPALRFAVDGTLAGTAGLNQVSGEYRTNGSSALSIGPLATTRMAGPPEQMAAEAALCSALEEVEGFSLRKETLFLLASGQPILRLGAGTEDDLR
ncbi:MAG: META domain-containing protein [Planctomycetota bacterium]